MMVEVEGDWDVFGVKPTHIEDQCSRNSEKVPLWYALLAISVCYLDNNFFPYRDNYTRPVVIPPRPFGELFNPSKKKHVLSGPDILLS